MIHLAIAAFALACFALSPGAQAVVPAPDGGYPGGNTAEGLTALLSLTTGGFNTAVGYLSLRSDSTNSFNTGVGAGALLANTADDNTAIGAGALLSNTIGNANTANGALALFYNSTGSGNTANGLGALFGITTGNSNMALGENAGGNLTTTDSNNIDIGSGARGWQETVIRSGSAIAVSQRPSSKGSAGKQSPVARWCSWLRTANSVR
jgi:hypothetical protein